MDADRRSQILATLVSLAVVLAAPSGEARAEGPRAVAKAHFDRGAKAYREARYQEAIDAFMAAYALDPDAVLMFNAGQASEKLARVPDALRFYRDYLRLAPAASDRPAVEASIRNLEARLRERGLQQVSVYSTPAGAELTMDGKDVGRTPWTGELSPGSHEALLRMAGRGEVRKSFALGAERAMDLDIDMGSPAGGAATRAQANAVTVPAGATATAEPEARVRPWTWTALGLGGALLGGSLGFELSRRGAESTAAAEARQIRYQELYDQAASRQNTARILAGLGAAVAATGGVLLVLELSGSGPGPGSAITAAVGGGCGSRECTLVMSGRF